MAYPTRTKNISMDLAKKGLTDYVVAFERFAKGYRIYRGLRGFNKEYAVVKPSRTIRTSKNTKNIYTALMGCLPSWQKWPDRARSVICSNETMKASSYMNPWSDPSGGLYVVLPKNNGRIAICPSDDIWNSFSVVFKRWYSVGDYGVSNMNHFNDVFEDFFYSVFPFFKDIEIGELDAADMKVFLEKAENDFDAETFSGGIEGIKQGMIDDVVNYKIKRGLTWIEYFDELLNPVANGFTLQTIDNYDIDRFEGREIWTDVDCLLVRIATERNGKDKYNTSSVNKLFKTIFTKQ
jgi:hypothetical protein